MKSHIKPAISFIILIILVGIGATACTQSSNLSGLMSSGEQGPCADIKRQTTFNATINQGESFVTKRQNKQRLQQLKKVYGCA